MVYTILVFCVVPSSFLRVKKGFEQFLLVIWGERRLFALNLPSVFTYFYLTDKIEKEEKYDRNKYHQHWDVGYFSPSLMTRFRRFSCNWLFPSKIVSYCFNDRLESNDSFYCVFRWHSEVYTYTHDWWFKWIIYKNLSTNLLVSIIHIK